MSALQNTTVCAVASFPLTDRHGRDVLVVVAKLSYTVSAAGEVRLALEQAPVRVAPELNGESAWSSERYPSDVVEEKPGTDVLFVGTAHPPAPDATFVDATVRVGGRSAPIHKTVRVHGPRVWQRGALARVTPGPAAALAPTPIVYERSFGGYDNSDPDNTLVYEPNPVGTGIVRDPARLIGTPAYVIEVVGGGPAGLGPIRADWEPRAKRAGTHDAAWARTRAPLRPLDYDPRHACSAPDELWSEDPLDGSEPIEVLGATPEGAWRFRLPRYEPVFSVASDRVPTHLDTLLIDGDARRVELTWRVALPLPRKHQRLGPVQIASEYDDAFYRMAGELLLELVRAPQAQ